MMFDYRHYVPVLRAKAAEWQALTDLAPNVRAGCTPLVELTPDVTAARPKAAARAGRTTLEHAVVVTLANIQTDLAAGGRRLFLDSSLLGAARSEAWRVLRSAALRPLPGLVPVIRAPSLDGRLGDLRFMAGDGVGVCLRITADICRRPDVARVMVSELKAMELTPADTDLVIDLGRSPQTLTHAQLRVLIPELAMWRSWTVLAGVFPLDLREFEAEQLEHRVEREEWTVWHHQLALAAGWRRPSFGDYTIQYGEYAPAPKTSGSLSLRYTLGTEWLILRGRKPNAAIGVGFDQYFGHAHYLTAHPEYYGAGFSAGDAFIDSKRAAGVPTGGRTQWLAAGINHHLTATVSQLRELGP
jgi:hypothetical protein